MEILEDIKNKSIMVIGDLMLDRFYIGKVKKIAKDAPVPIIEIDEVKDS